MPDIGWFPVRLRLTSQKSQPKSTGMHVFAAWLLLLNERTQPWHFTPTR